MEEVKLYTILKKFPSLVQVVFPTDAERVLSGKEIKEAFEFEAALNKEQERTLGFFKSYIDEIEGAEGKYFFNLATLQRFFFLKFYHGWLLGKIFFTSITTSPMENHKKIFL